MDLNQLITTANTKLSQAKEHFIEEVKKLRTGRAHPGMVDSLMVDVYGQSMPMKSVASISVPEPQLLQITPFDPNNLQSIADSIRNDQSLGLNPVDDGRVVRVNMPPMTTENRQDMVKVLNQKIEECMITARQIRHEAIDSAEAAEKNKEIGRDQLERFKKQIDELLAQNKNEIESIGKAKEQEIMTV